MKPIPCEIRFKPVFRPQKMDRQFINLLSRSKFFTKNDDATVKNSVLVSCEGDYILKK